MRNLALYGLFCVFFLSCGKEHPSGYRIKPPGARYLSSYQTMQLAGNFQNWNLDDPESYMELVDDYIWEKDERFSQGGLIQFKFVPDHHWEPSFGTTGSDTGLSGYAEIVSGLGTEIALNLPEGGVWRFHFNENTLFFKLTKSESFTGAIVGRVVFTDRTNPPYPIGQVKLCDNSYNIITTTTSDTATGNFAFYSLSPDTYIVIVSAASYIPETLYTSVQNDTVDLGEIRLQPSAVRQPPEIDGINDFLQTDLVAVDPTGDISERNLDLDSLWGVFVGDALYIGFNAYARAGFSLSYGLYISIDTTRTSGATRDPWNRNVRASFGMPEFALYIWHNDSGVLDEAQLCQWNGVWNYHSLSSIGGAQGHSPENHFIEIMLPDVAIGSPDSVFVELFTTGAENSHAQDTSPSDPNVQFSNPDWSNQTTVLSRFVLIKR